MKVQHNWQNTGQHQQNSLFLESAGAPMGDINAVSRCQMGCHGYESPLHHSYLQYEKNSRDGDAGEGHKERSPNGGCITSISLLALLVQQIIHKFAQGKETELG